MAGKEPWFKTQISDYDRVTETRFIYPPKAIKNYENIQYSDFQDTGYRQKYQ